ncbi:MAG: protein ral secretion pathway protein [Candidatus Parcubacteria bacterium]
MKNTTKQSGFTLIELLVVIAIIGLMSSIVTASLTSARNKALDSQRIQDMHRLEIEGGLALLEKKAIPTVAIPKQNTLASAPESVDGANEILNKTGKYIGIIPEDALAAADPLDMSLNTNFKNLFTTFFKAGLKVPEDPRCSTSNAATCYRAWYNGESIIIASTLRTQFHSSGKNVQYGIIIGKVSPTILQSACQNLNFPVYNTSASGSIGPSNPTCIGSAPASVIKGYSTGLDLQGADSTANGGYQI